VVPTPNLATLARSVQRLHAAGWPHVAVNAPGETSTATLAMLADAGATQVEPGHGFYTRSLIAPVSGIQTGAPRVEGLFTVDGQSI
jgi:predicted amino acid racemase